MKLIVDQLPYYGEFCPMHNHCYSSLNPNKCPTLWSKYKVCSSDNPHECEHLIEIREEAKHNG